MKPNAVEIGGLALIVGLLAFAQRLGAWENKHLARLLVIAAAVLGMIWMFSFLPSDYAWPGSTVLVAFTVWHARDWLRDYRGSPDDGTVRRQIGVTPSEREKYEKQIQDLTEKWIGEGKGSASKDQIIEHYKQEIENLQMASQSAKVGGTTDVVPDRHISRSQMEQMRHALLPFPAAKVGICTVKDIPERSVYASELGEAFRQAGWKPIRDPQRDLENFRFDQEGVLLIRHSQDNMPDLKPLLAAFVAGEIRHTVIDIGGPVGAGFYNGDVDTSTLVVFIGPRLVIPTVPAVRY